MELRSVLTEFVDWFGIKSPDPQPLWALKLWGNRNRNFNDNGVILKKYVSKDKIHLSEEGKRVILVNMRHHIHLISKTRSGGPNRVRPGSSTAR